MKRQLTLCGTVVAACLGMVVLFPPQPTTFGQQAGGRNSDFGDEGDSGLDRPGINFGGVFNRGRGRFGGLPGGNLRSAATLGEFEGSAERQALEQKIDSAFHQLKAATGDEAKAAATDELRAALQQAFDADMQQRQGELDKIKQRVAAMEALLEKRTAAKEDIIKLRLQVLINHADGLGWADDARGEGRSDLFGTGFGGLNAPGGLGRGRAAWGEEILVQPNAAPSTTSDAPVLGTPADEPSPPYSVPTQSESVPRPQTPESSSQR